jgi:hypothetical protein
LKRLGLGVGAAKLAIKLGDTDALVEKCEPIHCVPLIMLAGSWISANY